MEDWGENNMAMKRWILMRWSIHQSVTVSGSFVFAEMICSTCGYFYACFAQLHSQWKLDLCFLGMGKQASYIHPFHHHCDSVRASAQREQQPWLRQRHTCSITCCDRGHNAFIAWGLLPNLFRSNLSDCVQRCGRCWILSAALIQATFWLSLFT